MPELPEVETVRCGLVPVLEGAQIKTVILNRQNLRVPFPSTMVPELEGRRCIALRRRGKYIFADIEGGKTLVIHLGMSGSFKINPHHAMKHDHVEIWTKGGDHIVYNDPRRFGMMFFVQTGEEELHPSFSKMGPEPLGNDLNAPILHERLKNKKTSIKVALLDQSVVAGVGNIYACEALYMAGINPLRQAHEISLQELEGLVIAIKSVLNEAIASGGSSLRDHRQTDGSMGYFQHHFKVYDREGEVCPETGGHILRVIQGGRSTFFCPEKQG